MHIRTPFLGDCARLHVMGLMPGLCVRGVGFCSVCQGFERCVHALKACMVHGLEISRVVVYAATSLSRTVKPVLEEPGGSAERAERRVAGDAGRVQSAGRC